MCAVPIRDPKTYIDHHRCQKRGGYEAKFIILWSIMLHYPSGCLPVWLTLCIDRVLVQFLTNNVHIMTDHPNMSSTTNTE